MTTDREHIAQIFGSAKYVKAPLSVTDFSLDAPAPLFRKTFTLYHSAEQSASLRERDRRHRGHAGALR